MTEENYNYRTSQTMLRNQFTGTGKLQIPIIPKFQEKPGDFDDLLLIGFDKTHLEDQDHLNRMVHFFLYDYRFERVWKHPDHDLEKLSRYRAVLSPDFSMYLEMARVCQIYNVFRNRWCGAYWASKGMRVVPTVNWGDESTFEFCFDGIERGGVVAVSTYMASAHDNREDQKDWFLAGYNEMLRRIEPEKIICYNTPFPEMQGEIVPVDYDRSSWRYMNYERSLRTEDLETYKIGGAPALSYDTMEPYRMDKGGGSAYGGKWRPNPNKPNEVILQGPPNTIQRIFLTMSKGGYWVQVKYGSDGWAIKVRHETTHFPNHQHTNPHDHIIHYDPYTHSPIWVKPQINYPLAQYPNGAPEFKNMQLGGMKMQASYWCDPAAWRFKTISEFKDSIYRGGEIVIFWNSQKYGIFYDGDNYDIVTESLDTTSYQTVNELLEHMVGNDCLRDIITQAEVLDRAL